MNSLLIFLIAFIMRVSPIVLKTLHPILMEASRSLWKVAYPIAISIVQDLEKGDLKGAEKHAKAVVLLKAAVIATGKVAAKEISDAHLGMIVITAFINMIQNKP